MKQILFLLLLLASSTSYAQQEGINFFEGTWQEALDESAQQDKLIFVDAFTSWCGPCKRMAKEIFTNKKVGEFYNARFVNFKLDMEKGEGRQFRKKYRVNAFPTLLFINDRGDVVHKSKGGKPVDRFLDLGKKALTKNDKSVEFVKQYDAGERSPGFLRKYAYALIKSGKPHNKIVNEYLKTQTDLTREENLKFIYDVTTECDSKIFDLLIKHRKAIAKIKSNRDVEKRIKEACWNTVEKAVAFNSPDLLNEAKAKMKKHQKSQSGEFGLSADMHFYLTIGNSQSYVKAANKYIKKYVKTDATGLHEIAAKVIDIFDEDKYALKKAEQWAKKAANNGGRASYFLTYADVLHKNKKSNEALETAERALDLAKKENIALGPFKRLIKTIENDAP